ncbi:MAG: hypothetical protein K0U38_08845 [Epsilonproteobacteria bacterium]|nr:hypothetical protein [Campylobacterota bacterium]
MFRNFLYMILLGTLLSANDISYNFHINNHAPYQNEAIILDVNITQIDHSKVMLFKFNPKVSEAYDFHQIDFKESQKYHDLKHHYKYLIYPKQEGKVAIELEMIKSLTDDDKVAYAISGDRDNVKGLVKKDIEVNLEPLVLEVKAIPKATELVGDFKLSYKLDKEVTNAYEPVHLKVSLEGQGNTPKLVLLKESSDYHLFTQEPKVKTFYTEQGTDNQIEWDYALSAKEGFELPKMLFKGFNPKTKKSYELVVPAQKIEVNPVDEASLLDKENTPPSAKSFDWSWLLSLFGYLVVFVAGYLMPRDFWKRKKVLAKSDEDVLSDKIASAKTHKELLKLLLSENRVEYRRAIEALERVLYNGKRISLDKIKKMVEEQNER